MKGWRLVGLLAIASMGAVVLAAALPHTILAGDAVSYRERMTELFAGNVPYRDFAFEHQPLMIVPLGLAWLAGGFRSQPGYVFAFAAISSVCLGAVTVMLIWAGRRMHIDGWAERWLLVVVPLLPFLLFRNDSFVILLTVGALVLAMNGREIWSTAAATAGVLAKIWSAVIAPLNWWRGKRISAGLVVLASAAALAINFSPPVQAIQRASGLHTETLAGSAFGLSRALRRVDLEIVRTATAYIDAPGWALAINVLVGGSIGLLAILALKKEFNWRRGWSLVGALTAAGVVASPFFSPQYVSWFAPFAALRRRSTVLMVFISFLSLALVVGWFDLFSGAVWWWVTLFVRNVLVVLVAIDFALDSRAQK